MIYFRYNKRPIVYSISPPEDQPLVRPEAIMQDQVAERVAADAGYAHVRRLGELCGAVAMGKF